MKNILLLITVFTVCFGCSSDDDSSNDNDFTTTATIKVLDTDGTPVQNMTVYAYDEDTWIGLNQEPSPLHSSFESQTNSNGDARFSNIYNDLYFNSINNYSNTFRFTVFYTRDGTNYRITEGTTFERGDNRTLTINLQ